MPSCRTINFLPNHKLHPNRRLELTRLAAVLRHGLCVRAVPALQRSRHTLAVQLNRGVRWLLTSKRLSVRLST